MVASFKAAGTLVTSAGTALNVPWPAGHSAGDLGFLVDEASGNSAAQTAPAGWVEVDDVRDVATIAGSRFRVYWKRATSSSEANVTTYTSLDHQQAAIITFQDALASGDPINVQASDIKATISTTATMPSVATTVAFCLILWFCSRSDDSASTSHFGTPSNGATTGNDSTIEYGDTTGNGGGFVVAWGVKATAGVVGTTTMSKAVSTTDARITVAIAPAAVIDRVKQPMRPRGNFINATRY